MGKKSINNEKTPINSINKRTLKTNRKMSKISRFKKSTSKRSTKKLCFRYGAPNNIDKVRQRRNFIKNQPKSFLILKVKNPMENIIQKSRRLSDIFNDDLASQRTKTCLNRIK